MTGLWVGFRDPAAGPNLRMENLIDEEPVRTKWATAAQNAMVIAGHSCRIRFTYLIDIKFVIKPALTSSTGAEASA
jgi:hypothetical protein